jgi:hypothetical protein
MTDPKRTVPASVPVPVNTETASSEAGGAAVGTTDVSASTVGSNSALDTKPDARTPEGAKADQTAATAAAPAQSPLPTNRDKELQRIQKERAKKQAAIDKKNKKKKNSDKGEPASGGNAPVSTASAPNQGQPATEASPNPAVPANPATPNQ